MFYILSIQIVNKVCSMMGGEDTYAVENQEA